MHYFLKFIVSIGLTIFLFIVKSSTKRALNAASISQYCLKFYISYKFSLHTYLFVYQFFIIQYTLAFIQYCIIALN